MFAFHRGSIKLASDPVYLGTKIDEDRRGKRDVVHISAYLAPLRSEPLEVAVLRFVAYPFELWLLVRVAHVVRINRTVLSSALRCSRFLREIALLLALSRKQVTFTFHSVRERSNNIFIA